MKGRNLRVTGPSSHRPARVRPALACCGWLPYDVGDPVLGSCDGLDTTGIGFGSGTFDPAIAWGEASEYCKIRSNRRRAAVDSHLTWTRRGLMRLARLVLHCFRNNKKI